VEVTEYLAYFPLSEKIRFMLSPCCLCFSPPIKFLVVEPIFMKLGMYTVFIVQTYQSSQYVVPRGGIFLGKWRSSYAGSSESKMNVQSACALNTRYIMLPEAISTSYFINLSHQSVCLYVYPPIVARQRPGQNIAAATNMYAIIKGLSGASFSIQSVSYQGKYEISSQNFLCMCFIFGIAGIGRQKFIL
jgi:hypothetical protein